jgi:hypothetical protein
MTDEQLIEVMAIAIYRSKGYFYDDNVEMFDPYPWDDADEIIKQTCRADATAALSAIKAAGLAVVPVEPTRELDRIQPCGCIVCECNDDERCHGCGAKHCGTHPVGKIPNPVYRAMIGKAGGE